MRHSIRALIPTLLAALAVGCSGDPNLAETWIQKLSSDDTKVKLEAVDRLKKINDKAAVQPLTALLKESGDLKVATVKALASLGDPAAAKPLIDAIDYSVGVGADPASKKANEANKEIAETLAVFKDKSAVAPLVKLAETSKDEFVRLAAINALGAIGDASAVPALVTLATDESLEPLVNKKAIQALGAIGDPGAVPAIKKMLFHERKGKSFYLEASFAAFQIGPPASQPLLAVLRGEDKELESWADEHDIWREALYAKASQVIADLKNQEAVPTLLKYVDYTRPGVEKDAIDQQSLIVRMEAAGALGRMRVPEAAKPIAAKLNETEGNTRARYADALVMIGDPSVLPQLAACATKGDNMDKSNHARIACYEALSKLGDEKALAQWEAWEKAEPKLSSDACKKELSDVETQKDIEARDAHCKELGDNVVKILAEHRSRLAAYGECKKDTACWTKKLTDTDWKVRERAAFELGRNAAVDALPQLMGAVKDTELKARLAAILASDWVASSSKEALEVAKKGLPELDKQFAEESGKVQFAKVNEDLKRLIIKIRRLDRTGA